MKVLHIIPRFIGGGPERDLLALAAAWQDAGFEAEHRVLVLEPPISARLLLMARRHDVSVSVAKDPAEIGEAIAAAGVVEISYWNHPALVELLRHPQPPSRILVRCGVSGRAAPQALPAELADLADTLVFTARASAASAAHRRAVGNATPVDFVYALSDMSRLEDFEPRPHEGVRVGYLGVVEPTKMHPRFAELSAAVRNPSVTFDIFGGGTWAPALADRFEQLGSGDRVRFHGHVEDLGAALAEIDILGYPLAPDSYATSEKAVQEAMWAGIPAVVLAATAPAEYVEQEATGLVAERDEDYPRAIERLAGDAGLRRRLGTAAQTFAREHFDPAMNASRLRRIFEAVAGLPRRWHQPLPGLGEAPGKLFVRSLGDLAGPFKVSLDGSDHHDRVALAAAEASIATSSAVLAQGEGGVIHYRNTYPDDPHLRFWAALITRNSGETARAEPDLRFAAAHGLRPSN